MKDFDHVNAILHDPNEIKNIGQFQIHQDKEILRRIEQGGENVKELRELLLARMDGRTLYLEAFAMAGADLSKLGLAPFAEFEQKFLKTLLAMPKTLPYCLMHFGNR